MKSESIEALKKDLVKIGGAAGKVAGEKAGTEAGSKINIPKILAEAIAAATDAAEKAAKLAQASQQVNIKWIKQEIIVWKKTEPEMNLKQNKWHTKWGGNALWMKNIFWVI